jgi:hypothetical protein
MLDDIERAENRILAALLPLDAQSRLRVLAAVALLIRHDELAHLILQQLDDDGPPSEAG